jgi:putative transcriptional regulator
MSVTKAKNARKKKKSLSDMSPGARIIAGLNAINEALDVGGMEEVRKRFTVHTVRRSAFEMPQLSAADVTKIRASIGVSQAVFAAMLGVSANTIRAWEQGVNPPSGMAVRFLAEVRRNPDYWRARVQEAGPPDQPRQVVKPFAKMHRSLKRR